ncbi:MAG TPA: DISARM system phospholipase D-like protein DrmC [Micromonosporaceae bacterium]|nr:DISARM system phospholipase D-like protein DrmC [Micromonosporaceae bacterium]
MNQLIDAVAALARAVPSPHLLEGMAAALRGRDGADAVALGRLRAAAPSSLRPAVERLGAAWGTVAGVPGAALAGMLAAAHAAAVAERAAVRVEPVVTGPQTAHVPLRLTRQAFESVASAARHQLLVLTYSAYADARIVGVLRAAAERGVRVRLVVETTRASGGTLHHSALDTLRGLPAEFYVWSPSARPAGASPPSMHAKGIVADRHSAFITSANLSGHAFDANVEVGVRIVGGDVPARLHDHFEALIQAGVLVGA